MKSNKSKNILSKIKNYDYKKKFITTCKNFVNYAKYNIQFISFVILSLISCILIKIFTIGGVFNIGGTFFDFATIILIGCLAYLFKPKKQFYYLLVIMLIITLINVINSVYYAFFNSFASISLLATLTQASEQGGAVLEKLRIVNLIYIIMPIIFLIINRYLHKKSYFETVEKIEVSKKLLAGVAIFGGFCLFLNIATLKGQDFSRISKQWNREYIVERFGIVVYQLNDIVQTSYTKLNSLFGYEEAANKFVEYYQTNPNQKSDNKYTNMFKGYNVIAIHMESVMNFLIDYEINGVEVTPNLNKLVKESMYFDNFYSQVSVGTSSDAEFTFSTGLMPVQSGTVAVSYYDRTYESLQNLLKEQGYYTFSMHGNKASMWNRAKLHNSLGYLDFYSQEYYDIDETIGLGLSDRSFFNQSEKIIKDISEMVEAKENGYKNYMGTLITLSNHTPFADPYYADALDVTYHTGIKDKNDEELIYDYLEGQTIGNYLKSVHYADECLGEFIEYIKTHDEYKNTLIVMYGDHAAQLSKSQFSYLVNYDFETGEMKEEDHPTYVDYDYYSNEIFKKVPLIIWTPNENKNSKIKGTYSYPMGMVDVLPTISNMLGIFSKFTVGHDIFEVKNNNTVVFPNGNFLTNKVYYYNSRNEFKLIGSEQTIDDTYVDERKKYTENILDISNDIIVYNLIERASNRIGDVKNEE